jgi:hypothetical protein
VEGGKEQGARALDISARPVLSACFGYPDDKAWGVSRKREKGRGEARKEGVRVGECDK